MTVERRQTTRRRFLGNAAGLLAAPLVVKSSALGADGATPPSQRITLGAIGLGGRARGVLRSLTAGREAQTLAVCDVQQSRLEEAKRDRLATYQDFRELLARDDIDAVLITTPTHWKPLVYVR